MGTKSFAINGKATPTSTGGFVLGARSVYSDTLCPAGRINANGGTQLGLSQIGLYLGGNGGNRSVVLRAGGAASGAVFVASAGSASTQYGADVSPLAMVAAGSVVRAQADSNGSIYYGRDTAAGNTVNDETGAVLNSNSTLAGTIVYCEAPSVPQSPVATPNSSSQVTVTYAAAADDGGLAATGWKIRYSTDPTFGSGVTVVDSATTSKVITGLTPGQTYYFQVAQRNQVTDFYGTWSVWTSSVSASLGGAPAAPTGAAVSANVNGLSVSWVTPSTDNGSAIIDYTVDYSTDPAFGAFSSVTVLAGTLAKTITGLTPGTTYYARVKARNAIGTSAASGSANAATLGRTALDLVAGASVHVGTTQVAVRSDGANAPTLTLGYTAFGTGTGFTAIDTLPVGTSAGQFAINGSTERNIALVADTAGNLYVIGRDGANPNAVLVKRYALGAPNTWAASGALSGALSATGDALVQFAAVHAPGAPASILVLARRAGSVGVGALSYGTIDLAAVAASSGALFLNSGSDPSWLATPPAAGRDSGVLDITALVPGGTRLAIAANGIAVVDLVNGAVTGVSKSAAGTAIVAPRARVVGISAAAFALLVPSAGALSWTFYNTSATSLGSGTYAGANAQGGAFTSQWDAYYDRVAQLVTTYYVADDSARKLESIDISPVTFAATAPAVLTSAFGAVSSTNGDIRVPRGAIDERRILVEGDNLLAGVKSTAGYADTSGNVAPNAPALVDEVGYDATSARVFAWAFGDNNPLDTQVTYDLQIQRVSDSVNVVDVAAVASAAPLRNVAGGVLANSVNYRWRVRVTDVLGAQSAWSAYDTFTTSALGTLTITDPVADNPVGLETSSINVVWSYTQANGYVQTQRRVRLIRLSDSAVLSDTTMQASVATSYTVTNVPTDVPVRIEVSIVTNAPGTPTVGPVNRLLTTSYGLPMIPTAVLNVGESYIEVVVTNPAPTGSRPEVVANLIQRSPAGAGAFVTIASVEHNGTYRDHAVASGRQYDYRVRGVTA